LLPAAGTRDRGLRGVGIPVPEPDMSVETDGSLRFPSAPRRLGVSCICLVFVESGKARLAASAEEGATVMRE
jgi:hypothetical protein